MLPVINRERGVKYRAKRGKCARIVVCLNELSSCGGERSSALSTSELCTDTASTSVAKTAAALEARKRALKKGVKVRETAVERRL